jgi:hypothetical protein
MGKDYRMVHFTAVKEREAVKKAMNTMALPKTRYNIHHYFEY